MSDAAEQPIVVSAEDLRELRSVLASGPGTRDREAVDDLESELDRATVVPRAQLPGDVVAMNSTVEFEDANTRRRQLIQLVFPSQAAPGKGRISVVAPVGTALLGLRVGQCLDWPVPRGTVRVRILRVVQAFQGGPPKLG
ncbi:MAG TPA: nucleoside diphosphate kinase regulator [Myxococcales bacterium]|jgi:regulator of nucleoside diphosphate kinase